MVLRLGGYTVESCAAQAGCEGENLGPIEVVSFCLVGCLVLPVCAFLPGRAGCVGPLGLGLGLGLGADAARCVQD